MKRLLFLIVALALVAGVSAAIEIDVVNHNTDVQSTTSHLKVCSCGTTVDIVRVKNIGDLAATYLVSVEAKNNWFMLGKYNIYLEANKTEEVPIFISVPCGISAETDYTIHVSSEFGRYRSVPKSIQAGVCENIRVEIDPSSLTVQPCDTEEVDIYVTNTGTFTDTYTIQQLPDQELVLEAGETGTITTHYTAACDEYGEKSIPLTIVSKRNEQTVDRGVLVTVPRAYDYTFNAQGGGAACLDTSIDVPVSVRNTENRANTFVINTPGQQQTIYLEAGEQRTVRLPYTPAATGEQTFTATISGVNGSITKSASVRFNVEDCYSFTFEAPEEVAVCAGDVQIPFTLTGTGMRSNRLLFEVQSDMPAAVDSLQGIINPGQRLTKMITVSVPDADAAHYVTLVVNGSGPSSQATTAVQGYSTETCYRVETEEHIFRVFTDASVLPVVIQHTGIQPATYAISYNGTFLRPVEQNITLAPQQQAVLHFVVENATAYETGDYIDRLTLEANGVEYITDFRIELEEKGFWQRFKDAFYHNGEFAVCSIVSLLAFLLLVAMIFFVLGMLFGTIYYENPLWLSKQSITIIGSLVLIVLLVMMIVSGLSIPRTYERPVGPSNPSILYYEIGQADTLTLNLNNYFTDPDMDLLRYTANQPEGLRVLVENSNAIVEPSHDFSGSAEVVFTAEDDKGGMTDSDIITVVVVPYKPVTFLEYWQYGCWFFTAAFLFLAVALAMLVVYLGEKRKSGPKAGQIVLYKKPRTHVVRSDAHDLVEQTDDKIQPLPPGTNIGAVMNAEKIVINQGKAQAEFWVASEDGTKFHRMTCPVIKNMPAEKRIVFDSREEALKTGYTPCKTCSSHE